MTGKRPIHRVSARNFLSLEDVALKLGPLNVLAGPNGSGKTNFLRIFDFIGAIADRDLNPAIQQFGGTDGVFFRNAHEKVLELSIQGTITSLAEPTALDEYSLDLDNSMEPFLLRTEEFKFKRNKGRGRRITLKGADLTVCDEDSDQEVSTGDVSDTTSGLALLRRLGEDYEASQVEEVAELFLRLRFVDINVKRLGDRVPARESGRLREDGSNVAPFLLRLREEEPDAFSDVERDMRAILPTFERFEISRHGGGDDYVTLSIKETPFGDPTPLDQSSFGTLRAVVLFSMLNDPNPPGLTCIEEIDHGFHPQALDHLVDRMREATERTQIVLATHSPALVNRLQPDELIMFQRNQGTGGTVACKPSERFVQKAREKYGYELGELWFAGLLDDDQVS